MSNAADDSQYKTSANLSARADMFKRFGACAAAWHRWVFDHLLRAELPIATLVRAACSGIAQQKRQ